MVTVTSRDYSSDTYKARVEARLRTSLKRSNARACPSVILGKRCREFYSPSVDDVTPCLCRDPEWENCRRYDLFDHSKVWIMPNGDKIVTTEPYDGLAGSNVAGFIRHMECAGLKVTLFPGEHYDGTTLIVVGKQDF